MSEDKVHPVYANVLKAESNLKSVIIKTPLARNSNLSDIFRADIWLKREDLQNVRSYKIRGAYNKISQLSEGEKRKGIVCASAGNHAQGVAYSCSKLEIKGKIFMPTPTPRQKIKQVEMFGKDEISIELNGDTFDDCYAAAQAYCSENDMTFIHPFDDVKVIEGQATVGLEILQDTDSPIDYIIVPIGGGGLASGIVTVFSELSPGTRIIGVEPAGAPSMKTSLDKGKITTLKKIDRFIDGAAVKRVGQIPFETCRDKLHEVVAAPEGLVCSRMLELYNNDAIVVEPAGALSMAALTMVREEIRGKRVVCVVSGSNNDISRLEEIKEKALLYEGLKHYFVVRFPQRAGALREFVDNILGPNDDITHFEYFKKHNREKGPAVVGIELKSREDFEPLITRMEEHGFMGEYLNEKSDLFQFIVG